MTELSDISLWLTFRLDGMEFCLLSDYIESIAVPEKIEPVPDSPATLAGVTIYGGNLIGVVEMREVFNKISLAEYTQQFGIMKEMHVSWVEALDQYVKEGGEFSKPVDPHKCKFGIWYDSFHTDNVRLNRLLKKISVPHERLHACGAEILEMRAEGSDQEKEVLNRLAEADEICREEIVPLLNRLIDIYRSANRGVILVVNDGTHRAGLLVDDVCTLTPCKNTQQKELDSNMQYSPFVRELVLDGERILLEINVEQILGMEQESRPN